jgi:hypothetical protein
MRIVVPAEQQRATVERIWNAGGEIISIIPQRRSLEEIFLQVIAELGPGSAKGVQ